MKQYWSSSSFSRKKKEAKKSRVSKECFSRSHHHHPRGASSSLVLSFFVIARDYYKRLYNKYCCSLSLSLSLARARAKAAAAKSVFWSVDAKETTTTIQQLLKDTHETKTISIIHTQIRSIAVQNRTLLKRSALETEKTQSPCSSSQKKKLEAIGTLIRTFFGTFWTLFALGAVVKVVEVIIIIIFCVFNKES